MTEIELDAFRLERFVEAQTGVYEQVVEELCAGRKRSHWMWFIFPQIAGLGWSETAERFAISGRAEAAAYLRHEVLGPRLRQCTELVNGLSGRTAEDGRIREILGDPDDLKFRSSMTLFAAVAPGERVFQEALEKYFDDGPDAATLARL